MFSRLQQFFKRILLSPKYLHSPQKQVPTVFNFDSLEIAMGDADKSVSLIEMSSYLPMKVQHVYLALSDRLISDDNIDDNEKEIIKDNLEKIKDIFDYFFYKDFPNGDVPLEKRFFLSHYTEDYSRCIFRNVDGDEIIWPQRIKKVHH